MQYANSIARVVAMLGWSVALAVSGCMVGPDYKEPAAPLAKEYRQAGTPAIKQERPDLAKWWTVFGDPAINDLVQLAYRQNPTLQQAAVRVLETQAQLGIAVGLLFPQNQAAFGEYDRVRISKNPPNFAPGTTAAYNTWKLGIGASWELDVWGRYRRGIESADAQMWAAVANYDDVLVTLIANVASEYIQIRALQEELAVTKANVEVQKRGLQIAEDRFKGGTATDLDRMQATSLLRDTESNLPRIEAQIVQEQNRLCILLGIPPKDLSAMLKGKREIPQSPASVAAGIPAELLRRRPDVRRAERDLAAQSALIGVAKSDLYPSFSLNGDFRVYSEKFSRLFDGNSVQAFVGPSFNWALLNYGRIENNVRVQDAKFQELVSQYETVVLQAQSEVENSIALYLGAQGQVVLLNDSVVAAARAVDLAEMQYRGGIADYTRVLNTQSSLQTEQSRLVSSRRDVALNLVSMYRALGGGWELRGTTVPIDPKIQQQMRQRTDWGNFLPVREFSK